MKIRWFEVHRVVEIAIEESPPRQFGDRPWTARAPCQRGKPHEMRSSEHGALFDGQLTANEYVAAGILDAADKLLDRPISRTAELAVIAGCPKQTATTGGEHP